MNSGFVYISGQELARLCGVSIRTAEGWRHRKQGPPYHKRPNGRVMYLWEHARAFIEEYTGKPVDKEPAYE